VPALWPECQRPKQPACKATRRQRSVPRQHDACTTPSCRGCRPEKIQATQYRATISEKWLTGATKGLEWRKSDTAPLISTQRSDYRPNVRVISCIRKPALISATGRRRVRRAYPMSFKPYAISVIIRTML
jgi:hypothetical protein